MALTWTSRTTATAPSLTSSLVDVVHLWKGTRRHEEEEEKKKTEVDDDDDNNNTSLLVPKLQILFSFTPTIVVIKQRQRSSFLSHLIDDDKNTFNSIMKIQVSATAFVLVSLGSVAVSAFQTVGPKQQQQQQPRNHVTAAGIASAVGPLKMSSYAMQTAMIDVTENAPRDVYSMQSWAQGYGVQLAPGVEIGSNDGEDYSVMTTANIPAGSPVMFVPSQLVLSSGSVEQEFGGQLQAAEQTLVEYEGTAQRLPLFRLMIKVLVELEKGDQSPWYAYLNSLPRRFYNGAAMTGTFF